VQMVDLFEVSILFYVVIVFLGAAFGIVNTMLMAVFERIREFGVLKAIGWAPTQVLLVIFGECAVQTALAILIGLALAVPGLWYLVNVGIDMGKLGGMAVMGLVMDPIWRGVVEPNVILEPLFTLLFIVAIAAVYPATKAAWISPIRAIQHR